MPRKLPPDQLEAFKASIRNRSHIIFDPHHPNPESMCMYVPDQNGTIWLYDIRWRDEGFVSVERMYANPHYCRWVRETYGLRSATRLHVQGHRQAVRRPRLEKGQVRGQPVKQGHSEAPSANLILIC
jgi:hypothetical protein